MADRVPPNERTSFAHFFPEAAKEVESAAPSVSEQPAAQNPTAYTMLDAQLDIVIHDIQDGDYTDAQAREAIKELFAAQSDGKERRLLSEARATFRAIAETYDDHELRQAARDAGDRIDAAMAQQSKGGAK